MTDPDTLTWQLLPKQKEFLDSSTAREVLYSGAFGAGKTRAVCMRLVLRAMQAGAVEGLCRKHLALLKMTTLRTLLEPEAHLPAVLPPGTYDHKITEQRIHLHYGGQIVYFGFGEGENESRTKIGSLQLSGCGVDQAEELSAAEWTMLRGRIRLPVDGLNGQLYAACNPASPSHHLAIRFGLDGEHHPAPGCQVIRTRSADNFFLPDEYLADLESFTGLARLRYVEGLWRGSEGLVYDRWDRHEFVRPRDEIWTRVVVGIDEGYTNPAVMLLLCQDALGNLHIGAEWYKPRQLESAVVEEARRWSVLYSPEAFVLDPSAAKLRAAIQSVGLLAVEANNDVFGGIQAVQRYFCDLGAGPRLTIDPSCTQTIRELETYEWMPGQDKPRKAYDHAMDALRYAVMHLKGRPQLRQAIARIPNPWADPRTSDFFT